MKLLELLDTQDYQTAYYDPAEDEANARHINDTRKPKLTLKHLNRLKKIRQLRKLELLKRQDQFTIQYGVPDDPSGLGGGLGGPPGY